MSDLAPAAAPAAETPPAAPAATAPISLLSTPPLAAPPPAGGETPAPAPAADTPPAEGETPAEAPKPPDYSAITLPEGVTEGAVYDAFKEAAGKSGLAPEAAQALVDAVGPKLAEQVKAQLEAPYKAWTETQTAWVEEIKADPVIGGAKLDENLAMAATALDAFGGQKLREALDFTGAGNNPEVVKAFIQMGKMLTEGKFIPGSPPPQAKSAAKTLYPDMA